MLAGTMSSWRLLLCAGRQAARLSALRAGPEHGGVGGARGALYRFAGVRGNPQGFFQRGPVLLHPQGEVLVPLVHCGHALLYLGRVGVALVTKAVRQLYQQLHSLFGLLQTEQNRTEGKCCEANEPDCQQQKQRGICLQHRNRTEGPSTAGSPPAQTSPPSPVRPQRRAHAEGLGAKGLDAPPRPCPAEAP